MSDLVSFDEASVLKCYEEFRNHFPDDICFIAMNPNDTGPVLKSLTGQRNIVYSVFNSIEQGVFYMSKHEFESRLLDNGTRG